jgi:hypothetical protein
MAEDEFDQRGMIKGFAHLYYVTSTGERTGEYTLILREYANVITQKRFGRNFDDLMYLLDNGRMPRDRFKRAA